MILSYLPILKLDLHLTDQLMAPHFFVLYLILVFTWAFSGPILATSLTVLAILVALYLALSTKEPALFLQSILYAVLFVAVVFFLLRLQRKNNRKQIQKDKESEALHAVKIEQAKKEALKEVLEKKIHTFLDLRRFSEDLKTPSQMEEAAQKMVEEISRVMGKAEESVLYLVDESRQGLQLMAGSRVDKEPIKEKEGTLFDHWVMKRSLGVMVEDSQNDFRFPADDKLDRNRLRSLSACPLVTENKVLGVLRVGSSKPNAFSTDDLRLLDIFSSLGAVTFRNILLYQRMGELAIRDGLTGLYLNRYFQGRLAEEIERGLLSKSVFSVLLLDVDHFKVYNDDFGHAAGDIVLKTVADVIRESLEPADLVARYGGEEFVILLPNKTKGSAVQPGASRPGRAITRAASRVHPRTPCSCRPDRRRRCRRGSTRARSDSLHRCHRH